jgi:hypothetical protein
MEQGTLGTYGSLSLRLPALELTAQLQREIPYQIKLPLQSLVIAKLL